MVVTLIVGLTALCLMAFIRVKKIKGNPYAYLVESQWDPVKKASRQRTLKYLGQPAEVTLEDVPEEYRTEKVEAFVLRHSLMAAQRRSRLIVSLRNRLRRALLAGSVPETREVTAGGLRDLGVDGLYVHVITAAMHEVGELWARREIYVSHEHLATNTMTAVIVELNASIAWTGPARGSVVLATPDGERHMFVAQVLKGLLANRGYRVLDISDSAPTESIVAYVAQERPRAVYISVTMREHLPSARRLVEAVRKEMPEIPIVLGGRAVERGGRGELPEGVAVAPPDTLLFLDDLGSRGGP